MCTCVCDVCIYVEAGIVCAGVGVCMRCVTMFMHVDMCLLSHLTPLPEVGAHHLLQCTWLRWAVGSPSPRISWCAWGMCQLPVCLSLSAQGPGAAESSSEPLHSPDFAPLYVCSAVFSWFMQRDRRLRHLSTGSLLLLSENYPSVLMPSSLPHLD